MIAAAGLWLNPMPATISRSSLSAHARAEAARRCVAAVLRRRARHRSGRNAKPPRSAVPAVLPSPKAHKSLTRKKTLLCRPQGGLNDMLCQVELCRDYAARHGMRLIVDTLATNETCMPIAFEAIFVLRDCGCEVLTQLTPQECTQLNRQDTQPTKFFGILNRRISRRRFMSRLDFSTPPTASVMVHVASGGGSASTELIAHKRLAVNKQFISRHSSSWKTMERLVAEAGSYEAVHIRNTDLQTPNYKDQLSIVFTNAESAAILVCSDCEAVLVCAAEVSRMTGKRLMTPSQLSTTGPAGITHDASGKPAPPIHINARNLTPQQVKIYLLNILRDLYIMSHASRLHLMIPKGRDGPAGFSRLAHFLQQNPPARDAFFDEQD